MIGQFGPRMWVLGYSFHEKKNILFLTPVRAIATIAPLDPPWNVNYVQERLLFLNYVHVSLTKKLCNQIFIVVEQVTIVIFYFIKCTIRKIMCTS